MTDKKFQQLLETVRTELHKRMGKKMCAELDAGCVDCQTRFLIGLINHRVAILEPFHPTKKQKKIWAKIEAEKKEFEAWKLSTARSLKTKKVV